jgi:CheY-like chemotaxis protein
MNQDFGPDRAQFEALPLNGRLQFDADFANLIDWIGNRRTGRNSETLEWRVLIAEDDAANRLVLTSLLEKSGLLVTVAENGREALKALARETVDLVLLDINMPELDGLATAHAIRALPDPRADLPIIAITSDVSPSRVNEMRDAGFDICMEKPVRRDTLFRVILGALSGRLSRVA